MITNEERIERASHALRRYLDETGNARDALTDLLTDLRHTYRPETFRTALRLSEDHYNVEKGQS